MAGSVGSQAACDLGLFCKSLEAMVVAVEHQKVFIVCLLWVVGTEQRKDIVAFFPLLSVDNVEHTGFQTDRDTLSRLMTMIGQLSIANL